MVDVAAAEEHRGRVARHHDVGPQRADAPTSCGPQLEGVVDLAVGTAQVLVAGQAEDLWPRPRPPPARRAVSSIGVDVGVAGPPCPPWRTPPGGPRRPRRPSGPTCRRTTPPDRRDGRTPRAPVPGCRSAGWAALATGPRVQAGQAWADAIARRSGPWARPGRPELARSDRALGLRAGRAGRAGRPGPPPTCWPTALGQVRTLGVDQVDHHRPGHRDGSRLRAADRRAAAATPGPTTACWARRAASAAAPSGVRWVIDPLDGTTNYVYRHPGFAVSIAAEVEPDAVRGRRGRRRGHRRPLPGRARRRGAPATASRSSVLDRDRPGPGAGRPPASATSPSSAATRAGCWARCCADIRDIRRMGSAAARPVLGGLWPGRRLLRAEPGARGTSRPAP